MHEGTVGARVPGTVDSGIDSARWVSLAEAARVLGVSEKTARRRAKAGQLQARLACTPHGPAWQERVPMGIPEEGRVGGDRTQAATVVELVRLVGELQAKAEAAALWQGRAETLAHQRRGARETIRALAAPTPEPAPEPDPFPAPIPPTPDAASLEDRWQTRAAVAAALLFALVAATLAPAWVR